MNAQQIGPIKELLARNHYRVELTARENGCIATFPERIEEPTCPSLKIFFGYTPQGLYAVFFNEEKRLSEEQLFDGPLYAQKLMMFSHIITRCMQIGYNPGLIAFLDGEKELGEEEFYPLCNNTALSAEEQELENALKPIVIGCLFSTFTRLDEAIAKETQVLDGYVAIRNMIYGKPEEEPQIEEPKEIEEDATQEENTVGGGS